MREIYRARRDNLFAAFTAIPGLEPLLPEAGMFMMVKVVGSGYSAREFTWALYAATGVSVLDATAFGASAEGYVRVSYTLAEADLEEALRRIKSFMESLA